MKGLFIVGTLVGVILLKEYLVDMIKQYYDNKEKEQYKQNILNMKL